MNRIEKISQLGILFFGAAFACSCFAGSGQSTHKPKTKRQVVQSANVKEENLTPFEEPINEERIAESISSCSTESVTVAEEIPLVLDEIVNGQLRRGKFDDLKLSDLILENAPDKLSIQLKFRTIRGLKYQRRTSAVGMSNECTLYRFASNDPYTQFQGKVYFDPKAEKNYRLKASTVNRNRGFYVTKMVGTTTQDGNYKRYNPSGYAWDFIDSKLIRSEWVFDLAQWNKSPSSNFYKMICKFQGARSENINVRQLRESVMNHFSVVIDDQGLYQPDFLEKSEEVSN